MRPRLVVDGILKKRECRNADRGERHVIRAPPVENRQGRGPEIRKRAEETREDSANRLVALKVDAADTPGSMIEVEVGGNLLLRWQKAHRLGSAEMFAHVSQ